MFGVFSSTFQPFPACYCLFRVVPLFTSDNVTKCFDLQIYYSTTILTILSTSTKEWKCHYKVGQLFWITKQGKWYYKVGQVIPSGTIFITKWGNNHKVGQYRRQMKKTREIDSGNLLLHSPLIFLATVTLPLGILQKLKFCYNQKKEETKPPTTDISAWFVSLRNNYLQLFLVLKTFFHKNSSWISRNLSITETYYRTTAGATLLKLASAMDILLPILQEFRNIFLKEHLRKAPEATQTCFNLWFYIQAATRGVL